MMDMFLKLSGDDNPLHRDTAFAAARGFRDRVAYGLLSASFYSTLAGVHLPGRNCLLHGVDVSFLAPVYVGDVLTVAGEIIHLTDAYRQAQIAATITNGQGEKVSKAKIRIGLIGDKHG
jgi:3-hydroxybutyryl-CoA dehydratase